jgi:hypothetical protein
MSKGNFVISSLEEKPSIQFKVNLNQYLCYSDLKSDSVKLQPISSDSSKLEYPVNALCGFV